MFIYDFFFLLADYLGHKLSVAWEEECNKKQMKHKEPSLVKAVLKVFGLRFAALGFVLLILELGLRYIFEIFKIFFLRLQQYISIDKVTF